jgi:hypothetical protein
MTHLSASIKRTVYSYFCALITLLCGFGT